MMLQTSLFVVIWCTFIHIISADIMWNSTILAIDASFVGSAQHTHGVIQLTSQLNQVGAVWWKAQQPIRNGFSLILDFDVASDNTPSEVFAFVIQANSATALSTIDTYAGFDFVNNIAFEMGLRYFAFYGASPTQVNSGGAQSTSYFSVSTVGGGHTRMTLVYNNVTQLLSVSYSFSDSTTSGSAEASNFLFLNNYIALSGDDAWIGFTGASGGTRTHFIQINITGMQFTTPQGSVIPPTNPCDTSNCSPFATCNVNGSSFYCTCNTGYIGNGTTCSIPPSNPCNNSNCSPYATCHVNGTLYYCTCNAGYTGNGTTCSISPSNPCNTSNCSPYATCQVNGSSYYCTCNVGYTGNGTTCSIPPSNPCNTSKCSPSATCHVNGSSYYCTCNAGYTGNGTICSISPSNPCNTSKCSPYATCHVNGSSYYCTCNVGYTGNGTTCSISPSNPCNTSNCSQYATCNLNGTTYYCTCNAGYIGDGVTCTNTIAAPHAALVSVHYGSDVQISLSWSDPKYSQTFVVELSTDNITFTTIYNGSSLNFTLRTIISPTTYNFRVKAFASPIIVSPYSNIVPTLIYGCLDSICNASIGENCSTCPEDCCALPCVVNCTRNGYCDYDKCICYGSYSGPDCSLETLAVETTKNPSTAVLSISANAMLFNAELIDVMEVNQTGHLSQRYLLSSFAPIFSSESSSSSYHFNLNSKTTLDFTIDLYETGTKLQFAKQNISLAPNTFKLTIKIANWIFDNFQNSLLINMKFCAQNSSDSNQCIVAVKSQQMGGSVQWITESMDILMLYVQFERNGLTDGTPTKISTTFNSSTQTATFAIPHFWHTAVIDPDMSVVVDPSNKNSGSHSNNKWIILAVEIIGGIVGVVVLVLIIYWIVMKVKVNEVMKWAQPLKDEK